MKATAFGIKEYQYNFSGKTKLKGIVNFGGGAKLKVWEEDLHKKCLELAQFPPHEIRYEFRHSDKWGDSLTKIQSTKQDYELLEMARMADEARGRMKPNSYLGHKITQSNKTIAPETPVNPVDITQANTVDELMKRVV